MQIIRLREGNYPIYSESDHWSVVIICQTVTLFYINLSRNFFWSHWVQRFSIIASHSHLRQPFALQPGRISAVKTASENISNIIWQHKLLPHHTTPSLPPSLQLRAQCVQNSNCDDERARERAEGRPRGGAASQRVAWWHSLGLNCGEAENISAADLFN